MECILKNEAGEMMSIKYAVTKDEVDKFGRRYGISITVKATGKKADIRVMRRIFFTYGEAKLTAEFMCRYKVLPCTAKDVLSDLMKTID